MAGTALETALKQLRVINASVREGHHASDSLRDIRREADADQGVAWRLGERLDIALGDARNDLDFLIDFIEMSLRGGSQDASAPGSAPGREDGCCAECGECPGVGLSQTACFCWPRRSVGVCPSCAEIIQWASRVCREKAEGLKPPAAVMSLVDYWRSESEERERALRAEMATLEKQFKEASESLTALQRERQAAPSPARSAPVRLDPQRNFSSAQKKEILLRSNGHCVGCGQEVGSNWHADHIVPHSRGGRTEVSNGQALCQPCNSRKSAKVLTVDE